MKTLILALGNPLRADDGIGLAILDALEQGGLPDGITTLDGGTSGLEMLLLWRDYDHVIIIDAASMGLEAGQWAHVTPDEVRHQSRDMYLRGTIHYAGLAEAIALAKPMNMMPPRLDIFGIEPASLDWDIGLSKAVRAVIPHVCQAIRQCAREAQQTPFILMEIPL